MRAVAALLAVGCGAASPTSTGSPSAEPRPAARATPAPEIGWHDRGFATDRLPVVARGGELAVVAVQDSDAGRGWPNLRIEVRDRNDRVIQTIAVMISNDYETLVSDDRPGAELSRRIADANRELARLHGAHDLIAMRRLELQPPTDDALPHLAIGEGLDVDWASHRIEVFHHNTHRPFRSVDGNPWLAPAAKRCAQCDACDNPAFLHAVYKATAINAIVVELAYRGSDTCWEPGHQLHVITW